MATTNVNYVPFNKRMVDSETGQLTPEWSAYTKSIHNIMTSIRLNEGEMEIYKNGEWKKVATV